MIAFLFSAPHVEFTKPLHDVEVREKESARFECEVSRENAKVCVSFCTQYGMVLSKNIKPITHLTILNRFGGSKMVAKSEKAKNMRSFLKE